MSDFYTRTFDFNAFSKVRGSEVRFEFDAIAAAFLALSESSSVVSGNPNFVIADGSENALTVTTTLGWTTYSDKGGFRLSVRAAYTNTGPATMSVDGLSARALRRNDNQPLIAGDIRVGGIYEMIYDAGEQVFRVTNAWQGTITEAQGFADAAEGFSLAAKGWAEEAESWANISISMSELPSIIGQGGKFLSTDGTTTFWEAGFDGDYDSLDNKPTLGNVAAMSKASANEIRSGSADKILDAAGVYEANAPVTSSGSGNYSFELNTGRNFFRTLTGNSTIVNPTNQKPGESGLIYLAQDGTGGRTISWASAWKQANSFANVSDDADAVNVFSYFVRANNAITLFFLGVEQS